jgi:uncharacterized membrane protein (DUF485 family)
MSTMDWAAMTADPEFVAFARYRTMIVAPLLATALTIFFAYPIVCGFFPALLAPKAFGAVSIGLVATVAEALAAFAIALIYIRVANGSFDKRSASIARRFAKGS